MTIGIRDTRKIDAAYNMTERDVRNEARSEDSIGIYPEFIDGYGVLVLPTTGRYMHVPYRSMLPKDVKGLLVTGRAIGGDRIAHAAPGTWPVAPSPNRAPASPPRWPYTKETIWTRSPSRACTPNSTAKASATADRPHAPQPFPWINTPGAMAAGPRPRRTSHSRSRNSKHTFTKR